VVAGPLSTAEGSYVALTRAREHTYLYASSEQLELSESRAQAIAALAERLGRSEPDLPSIRIPLAHEQHVEREHVKLALDVDRASESVDALRAERDRLQAIVDTYPRDAADQIESLERDAERFRANGESWREEAERYRSELAALGPLARRGKHASELSTQMDSSERRAQVALEAGGRAQAKLAEIKVGPDSPARWEAEHPEAREQLREAEKAFTHAVEREADRAIANPGAHLTRVLGERPTHDQPAARETWERVARAVEAYRVTYDLDPVEQTALGGEPDHREARGQKHIDWRSAGKQVLEARAQLDIERPEHGPTEERMAQVLGLMPEQDREHLLDRGHDLGL
jgi:hypothetical protein